jgi:hypothetical protein
VALSENEKHSLIQAAALLKLFRQENGREASGPEELAAWLANAKFGKPVDPYKFLTEQEIEEALKWAAGHAVKKNGKILK